MNEPILTYTIQDSKDEDSTLKIAGYADGSLDITCVHKGEEGEPSTELSFTPKGIAALKRALALWESAIK